MRNVRAWVPLALALAFCAFARADDGPEVEHQPVPCTIPGKPLSLCANVSSQTDVAKARIYFRRAGEEFYNMVDMEFDGIKYCGTVPAPLEGKIQSLEYYIQAIDTAYQAKRTSTFQIAIQGENTCEFPPIEKDPTRIASIKVFATHKKQGKKLDDAFSSAGVTFVPLLPAK